MNALHGSTVEVWYYTGDYPSGCTYGVLDGEIEDSGTYRHITVWEHAYRSGLGHRVAVHDIIAILARNTPSRALLLETQGPEVAGSL